MGEVLGTRRRRLWLAGRWLGLLASLAFIGMYGAGRVWGVDVGYVDSDQKCWSVFADKGWAQVGRWNARIGYTMSPPARGLTWRVFRSAAYGSFRWEWHWEEEGSLAPDSEWWEHRFVFALWPFAAGACAIAVAAGRGAGGGRPGGGGGV